MHPNLKQASQGVAGGSLASQARRDPRVPRGARKIHEPAIRVVLRGPVGTGVKNERTGDGNTAAPIAPIVRGLAVLAAFKPDDEWLGNQELAARTGIPKPTITRLTQTLMEEGFLKHSAKLRKYRLAAAVLGLGYVTMDNADIASMARPFMQRFADECGVFVSLAGRDSLHVSLVENCHSATSMTTLGLNAGARFPLASCPFGLALLGGIPSVERNYLLDHIRLRYEKEYRISLRVHVMDAVAQVAQKGYFMSDWGSELNAVAAPLNIPDRPPMVIGCAGPAKVLTRERLREDIGPRLMELVGTLQSHVGVGAG